MIVENPGNQKVRPALWFRTNYASRSLEESQFSDFAAGILLIDLILLDTGRLMRIDEEPRKRGSAGDTRLVWFQPPGRPQVETLSIYFEMINYGALPR